VNTNRLLFRRTLVVVLVTVVFLTGCRTRIGEEVMPSPSLSPLADQESTTLQSPLTPPEDSPIYMTPEPGKGALVGRILNYSTTGLEGGLVVYLWELSSHGGATPRFEGLEWVSVVDSAGTFSINNILPGRYLVVSNPGASPAPLIWQPLEDAMHLPLAVYVEEGQTLEVEAFAP